MRAWSADTSSTFPAAAAGARNSSWRAWSAAGTGRVGSRLSAVPDASKSSLLRFVADNVTSGSSVHTDGWISYRKLHGYDHRPCNASQADNLDDVLPRVHRVISNLKN